MNRAIVLSQLAGKFPAKDVKWRVGSSGVSTKGQGTTFMTGKPWIRALAYIDNRAIEDRLDEVCGPENWQNKFEIHGDFVLCGIGILVSEVVGAEPHWVWKWDGAGVTDIEPVKGALSDAMKRAGQQWGIGRYLYNFGESWGEIVDVGEYRATIKEHDGKGRRHVQWDPPGLPRWALIDAENASSPPPAAQDEPKKTRKGKGKDKGAEAATVTTGADKAKKTPCKDLERLIAGLRACSTGKEIDSYLVKKVKEIRELDYDSRDEFVAVGKQMRLLVVRQKVSASHNTDTPTAGGGGLPDAAHEQAMAELAENSGDTPEDLLKGFGEDFFTNPPKPGRVDPTDPGRDWLDLKFNELVALIARQSEPIAVLTLLNLNEYGIYKMGVRGGEIISIARKRVENLTKGGGWK